ncbi:hypothetical protein [Nitrososphaera sp. AFS]|uniref:hypothetical protein n=1 Tax=Nitrososphaera sp. AFS TaxID=2301191 RepID=UPI0013922577|nr:hypothetical protein [Nitrososphaera sp. AFS]
MPLVSSLIVSQYIIIVVVARTNMNRLFLISGIVVFVGATLLIINTANAAMAYSCSNSVSSGYSGRNNLITTGVTGSSGSCASTSSASTLSPQSGKNNIIGSATGSGPNSAAGSGVSVNGSPLAIELFQSTSAGGAQSSCSSSSVTNTADAVVSNSQSTSKPGTCQ